MIGHLTIDHHSKEEPKIIEPPRALVGRFDNIAQFGTRSKAEKNGCYNYAADDSYPNLMKMWVEKDKRKLFI